MIFLQLSQKAAKRRLPFYLAMEEWAATRLPAGEYVFTWIVEPTVICGRNQDIDAEVDLEYCRSHDIDVCRRKSGGGCVYADKGNVMVSYIAPSADVESTFSAFAHSLASWLRSLGLNAEATGRNDVLVEGRKVAGGAFYRMPTRSIAHSTLLHSVDIAQMVRAITPSRAKLQSKGVQSVAKRVANLSEFLPDTGIDALRDSIIGYLATQTRQITDEEIKEITEIEQKYYDPAWLAGKRRAAGAAAAQTLSNRARVEGVGEVCASVAIDQQGAIEEVALSGDFFALADFAPLAACLRGLPLEPNALAQAIEEEDLRACIPGLPAERLVSLLANATI